MSSVKSRFIISSGLIVLLVVVAVGAWSVVNVMKGRDSFSAAGQADASAATLLSIDTANAGVSLKASSDSFVHVSASGKYTGSTPPKLTTSTVGATITVSQSCSGDCDDFRLDISLPERLAVKVTTVDGGTTARGLAGSLEIRTRSGGIDLSDPSGPLALNSTTGQILVAGATSDRFEATTTGGEVRAAFRTAPTMANVTTGNGGVDLTLPSSGYYIQATSANSNPKIDIPVDRKANHTVTVKTNNGGIDIHH
ncbi:DUF4097 family beta strand repeat-containing protein [Streptomyces sp. Isolate_45]|uniref:DUF4097 family beta strand repeat-containing protein n=1 Tax=Streptomyces sp. Isolate_45 TaxID=2950111 RepID=UPI002481AF9A|nr:DUF4097 family beta strand repeat-containing protein [Streptomyces sp. Isolate_45]MDA5284447.1 DUF4097 family beta strand repeat-containing protein [Streptomyces sp. Isolate_45]